MRINVIWLLWLTILQDVRSATNAEWGHTINSAGMQRTLSQMMSKEFLLISLGIDSAANKVKLSESMEAFNSTLHALSTGDSSRGIVGSPDERVAASLRQVLDLWIPFEILLRTNVDTVRAEDGSTNLVVLEAVSAQNVPLYAASDAVVSDLVDAAKVAGASTNGLVQDIAGRQRSYIQIMCLRSLLIGQGVSLVSNKASLKESKLLFEASHEGIIEGVPFAGIPVLTNMCTLHQMREVTYYYTSYRPLVNEILNAHTVQLSQSTALRLAAEIANLTEPLFDAMAAAVQLFNDGSQACDPMSSMTVGDWRAFLKTLGQVRLETQQVAQYFMQVALGSNVQTSKVEITVVMSLVTQQMRSLIEGRKAEGIPAPATQGMVDALLYAYDTWSALETELTQGVRAEAVTSIMVDRVAQLSKDILEQLNGVMDMTVGEALVASPETPSYLLDVTSKQAMLFSKISKEAGLVLYGAQEAENWIHLNASCETFLETHSQLLLGAEATDTTQALPALSDVCVIKRMREVGDLYAQLQRAALTVARGSLPELENVNRLNGLATDAMFHASEALLATCTNSTEGTSPVSWLGLHQAAAEMARLSQDASSSFILAHQGGGGNVFLLESSALQVEASRQRLLFGSFSPHVAAPPTQALLDQVLGSLDPAARSFRQALDETNILAAVASGGDLLVAAESLQERYLSGAQRSNPDWPGARVDVAIGQMTLASRVRKEALLQVYDFRTTGDELTAAINDFEIAHRQLKDGGGGLVAVITERADLLAQWEKVDEAWLVFKERALATGTEDLWKLEDALIALNAELAAALPLYGIQDVKAPEGFPWTGAIYGSLAGCLVCCCCAMAWCQWTSKSEKDKDKPAAGRRGADEV